MKTILAFLAAVCIIACTVGVSHKIIVNSYSDSPDTLYQKTNKNYNITIVNYPVDTTDIKKAPNSKK